MTNPCLSCRRDFHYECGDPCCCANSSKYPDGFSVNNDENLPEPNGKRNRGRPSKLDSEIGDSAGRKRAAAIYKVDPEKPCEWQGLSNCGGGKYPIFGCVAGLQQHIQHGPIKATYRNERENIHLICVTCHNRWHTLNDPVYNEEEYEELPHNPIKATTEELVRNDLDWKMGKFRRTN